MATSAVIAIWTKLTRRVIFEEILSLCLSISTSTTSSSSTATTPASAACWMIGIAAPSVVSSLLSSVAPKALLRPIARRQILVLPIQLWRTLILTLFWRIRIL